MVEYLVRTVLRPFGSLQLELDLFFPHVCGD